MSRLIDADKLIEDIYSNAYACTNDEINKILHEQLETNIYVINNQPTAYELDKVVEQLEKQVDEYEKMASNCWDDEEDIVDILEFRAMGVRDSIEIVKAGGIDD